MKKYAEKISKKKVRDVLGQLYKSVGRRYYTDYEYRTRPAGALDALLKLGIHQGIAAPPAWLYGKIRGSYTPDELYRLISDENIENKIRWIPGYASATSTRLNATGKKLAKNKNLLDGIIYELKARNGETNDYLI